MLNTAIGIATLIAILASGALNAYSLWRMIQLTIEAREARSAALGATQRAERAAGQAAGLARQMLGAVEKQSADLQELAVNTNSIKDALIESTAAAHDAVGEKRGIAIGIAQERDKNKP